MAVRAHVDIRLLGPVAAFRDGEPGALGGPRQRAVLARLALVAGQVVTVDRLIDDVWSGDPPATATNTLQSYVSLLRRALGSADFVRRDGPGYVLDVDRAMLDVHRFEDGVTAATAVVTTDPAAALELLDTALGEWRGPCLADVADEEWARAAGVRWDELRLSAVEARFDALMALGRAGEAATGLERMTDEHPLREGFVRRLMIALYRSGRQAAALRAYSRTRALLADELGLDPTPELQALQTAILGHDPSLAGPAPVAPPPEPVRTPPGPDRPGLALPGPAARAAAAPLVGRDRARVVLDTAWANVLDTGQPRLAVVVGEAGAGKTSVAAHFATAVHDTGATVLWGRAAQEALVPFEALVQALRTALLAMPPRARQRVVGDRGPLAVLLPELLQLVPTLRAELPAADVERYLLFETVAEMLATESAVRPILLVVDDVQWADGATTKLLEHVLRHERGGRVLILATQRDPSEDAHPDLDRLLMSLARDDELVRVPIGALDAGDVGELLRLAGHADGAAADLRSATGGNAFFVTELIASGGDGTTGALPDSVRSMIGARADRLPAAAAQLLALAAVAGRLSTLPVLVAASDLDADVVLDAADIAVGAGLLREDGAGRLVTPHALVRHAVLGRLTGPRRQDLHRRVGHALTHRGGHRGVAGRGRPPPVRGRRSRRRHRARARWCRGGGGGDGPDLLRRRRGLGGAGAWPGRTREPDRGGGHRAGGERRPAPARRARAGRSRGPPRRGPRRQRRPAAGPGRRVLGAVDLGGRVLVRRGIRSGARAGADRGDRPAARRCRRSPGLAAQHARVGPRRGRRRGAPGAAQ